ncbi:MAG: HAMP domain-containing sensor histidine kinase [Clostridia bacterium]
MKSSKLTLRWKIFLILSVFIVLMLGVVWFFQLFLLDYFYSETKEREIKDKAELIASKIDSPDLDILLERIAHYEDITVIIIDGDGYRLHEAEARFSTIWALSPSSLAERYTMAIKNDGVFFETRPYDGLEGSLEGVKLPDSTAILTYIKIVHNQEGQRLGIIMDSTVTPISTTANTMLIQLLAVTGGMVLIAVIVVLVLSRQIEKPMGALIISAKELAAGKSDVVFDAQGYKEIDELSSALNSVSKEISRVEHLRRELISNVSHDLRTPLTLIKGYGEMMRDLPSESTAENIQILIDETERLANLVNDMLDLSKMQEGGTKLNLAKYDINASVSKIIDRHSRLLERQGYTIECEVDGEAFVYADEVKISQVIYNLLSNAVNYSGEDKTIIVKSYPKGDNIRLEVIDHGVGIDVDVLSHIWDRYYKSDKVHRRAEVGTGLGLSIVKSVISMHPGGVYGVESSVGHGSKFYIELPRLLTK